MELFFISYLRSETHNAESQGIALMFSSFQMTFKSTKAPQLFIYSPGQIYIKYIKTTKSRIVSTAMVVNILFINYFNFFICTLCF